MDDHFTAGSKLPVPLFLSPSKQSRNACLGIRICAFLVTPFLLTQTATSQDIPAATMAVPNSTGSQSDPLDTHHKIAEDKMVEALAFAEVRPGDKVADFLPSTGHLASALCQAVGSDGHVYSISAPEKPPPTQSSDESCVNGTTITLRPRNFPAPELHSDSDDPGWVYEYWSQRSPVESFAAPEPLDMIWIADSYHELHLKDLGSPTIPWVNTALLLALKPGGLLIVEDFAAVASSDPRHIKRLHRIAAKQVVQEITSAGFELVGESALLRRSDDRHTADAHQMGERADRFLLKFRRP